MIIVRKVPWGSPSGMSIGWVKLLPTVVNFAVDDIKRVVHPQILYYIIYSYRSIKYLFYFKILVLFLQISLHSLHNNLTFICNILYFIFF